MDDNDDEPLDPLIDALFDEVESLRMQVSQVRDGDAATLAYNTIQLFDAEMRCAIIEAETREEVMREMEERMRTMEEKYSRRLMSEVRKKTCLLNVKLTLCPTAGTKRA